MWRGRSLWKSNELEVWCPDEVSHLVAVDPLLWLLVIGELQGAYRAGEPHPSLGLVAAGLEEWAVGLRLPPSVVLSGLPRQAGPGGLAAVRGGTDHHHRTHRQRPRHRHQRCG